MREREMNRREGARQIEDGGEVTFESGERDRDRKSSNQVKNVGREGERKRLKVAERERGGEKKREREIERESTQTFAQSTCFAKIWIQLSLSIIIIFCMDFFSFVPLSRV